MQRRRKKWPDPAGSTPPKPDPTEEGFRAREGDTLTIKFDGATLQIAPYSTVTLDSAIYSRKLKDGEDPSDVFDQVYGYLKKKCLENARGKLAAFADEHRTARVRAGTERE